MSLPPPDKFVTVPWAVGSLVLCYGNAALWSIAPHCGWGRYAAEPNSFICSLDWHEDPTYLALAFLGSYVVPCAVMGGAYAAIWRRLAQTGKTQIRLKRKSLPANLNKVGRHCNVAFDRLHLSESSMLFLKAICQFSETSNKTGLIKVVKRSEILNKSLDFVIFYLGFR